MKDMLYVKVDLAIVEDCFQMGEFEHLTSYFLVLIGLLFNDVKIILQRYPENGNPIIFQVITSLPDFKNWVTPFLDRM